MCRTMKNFVKVIEKKEGASWRILNDVEETYGKDSVERQIALSVWAALNSVRMMFSTTLMKHG